MMPSNHERKTLAMQANYVQRMRLTFSKIGPTRYIGHLDLARTMERALNRARIPVAYTQGFNRRPRMQFAAALPLGFTSEGELADIWLTSAMEPEQLKEQLMARMAPGIIIHQVDDTPLSAPNMQTITSSADYQVTIGSMSGPGQLAQQVSDFLAQTTVMRERRGKAYDLRPLVQRLLVQRLSLNDTTDDALALAMTLSLQPGNYGRPDEVLSTLGLDPLDALVHRTTIRLATATSTDTPTSDS